MFIMIDLLLHQPKVKKGIKKATTYTFKHTVFEHQRVWKQIPDKNPDTFYPYNIIINVDF